jgi:tetratricopeptide (TPR) repeat protein
MSPTEFEDRYDQLIEEGLEVAGEDFHRAEALFLDALECAKTSSMNALLARAHTRLGMFYTKSGLLEPAQVQLMTAYAIACSAGLEPEISSVNGALGVLFWTRGDTERAEEFFYVGLTTNVQSEQDATLATSYEFISSLYSNSRLHAQARAHLRAALDIWLKLAVLDAQIRVQTNLATKRRQSGSLHLAEQGYLETEVLCIIHEKTAELATINLMLGELYTSLSKWKEAEARLCCAADISGQLGDHKGYGSAELALGHLAYRRGQWTTAESHLRSALKAAVVGKLVSLESAAQESLGLLCNALGRFEEALNHLGRALDLAKSAGVLKDEARSHSDMAIVYAHRGNWKAAEKHNREALALRKSFPEDLATSCRNLGGMLFELGRSEEALHYLNESLRLYTMVGDKPNVVTATTNLAIFYSRTNNHGEAAKFAKDAMEKAHELGETKQVIDSLMLLASIATRRGRRVEAGNALAAAISRARAAGNQLWEAECLRAQGEADLKAGDLEGAANSLQDALFAAEESEKPDLIVSVLGVLAHTLAMRGEHVDSKACHDVAIQKCRAIGQPQKIAELDAYRAQYLWRISEGGTDALAAEPVDILRLVVPAMLHFDEYRTKFNSSHERMSWASKWNGALLLALEVADKMADAQLVSEIVETQINSTSYQSTAPQDMPTSTLSFEAGFSPANTEHTPPIKPVTAFIMNGGARLMADSKLPLNQIPLLGMPKSDPTRVARVALGAYRTDLHSMASSIPTW